MLRNHSSVTDTYLSWYEYKISNAIYWQPSQVAARRYWRYDTSEQQIGDRVADKSAINNAITPAATYSVLPCKLSNLKTLPKGKTEYFTKAKFYFSSHNSGKTVACWPPKLIGMCIKQTRTNHIATKWAIMTFFTTSINILLQLKSEATFHTNIKQHRPIKSFHYHNYR